MVILGLNTGFSPIDAAWMLISICTCIIPLSYQFKYERSFIFSLFMKNQLKKKNIQMR